jgi:hypothetical protein
MSLRLTLIDRDSLRASKYTTLFVDDFLKSFLGRMAEGYTSIFFEGMLTLNLLPKLDAKAYSSDSI